MSVGHLILAGMKIRTLVGPPLPHEIVRDTATATVLFTNDEKPTSVQADPLAARLPRSVHCRARPPYERDTRAR